jgi:T5SS/PEP-CTERM-associated repeat protein
VSGAAVHFTFRFPKQNPLSPAREIRGKVAADSLEARRIAGKLAGVRSHQRVLSEGATSWHRAAGARVGLSLSFPSSSSPSWHWRRRRRGARRSTGPTARAGSSASRATGPPAGRRTSRPSSPPSSWNSTYTVTFITSPSNASALVNNGNVTFALAGQTYTLSSNIGLNVGGVAGQTGRLTVLNGHYVGDMAVGSVPGATGFLTIGADAVCDTGVSNICIGTTGMGTLTIENGAQVLGAASVLHLRQPEPGTGP